MYKGNKNYSNLTKFSGFLAKSAKGGVGCILINNVNYYVLHRLNRACAERLAGLADIEFDYIGWQI